MEENKSADLLNDSVCDQRCICKWLQWLLIVQIISLTHATLAKIINFGAWDKWLFVATSAATLFCIVKLWCKRRAYAVAVVLLSIDFICTLLWKLFFNNMAAFRYFYDLFRMDNPMDILEIGYKVHEIGEFFGIAAFFFELLAHHSLTKGVDKRLGNCWFGLSVTVLVLYILMQVLTSVVTSMLDQGTLNTSLYQQVYPLLNLPGTLLKVAYIVFLFKTERVLRRT